METLVVGAHGATGRRIVGLLVVDGHTVRGMIRDPAQAETISALGARPVIGDVEGELREAVAGCDAVVFAAGSGAHTGAEATIGVDQEGAKRTVDAAQAAGVRRFVMLSSMGTRDPDAGPASIRHYLRAKRVADDHLRDSDLAWTIVAPGRLTDDDGTGLVEAAEALDHGGEISRDDVAAVIVASLRVPNTVGKTFEVLAGELPIGAALEEL